MSKEWTCISCQTS